MTELMLEVRGPDGLVAIFSEDEGAGYFFVYKSQTKEVLAQLRIYESGYKVLISESEVQLNVVLGWSKMWSDYRWENARGHQHSNSTGDMQTIGEPQ
jgi:hypothetical protein